MGHKEELVFLGRDLGERRNYSKEVAALIDEEIKGIVGEGHDKAKRILSQQRTKMDVVVERLKVDETIDARKLDEILASAVGPTVWDPESAPDRWSLSHCHLGRCLTDEELDSPVDPAMVHVRRDEVAVIAQMPSTWLDHWLAERLLGKGELA